jgi:flagellar biosynthesis protein FliR
LQSSISDVRDALGAATLSLEQFGVLAALACARVLPLVVLTPLFGGQSAPARMRMGLLVLLTIALVPVLAGSLAGQVVPTKAGSVLALLAKELFVGITIGVVVQAMFAAYAATGALVDVSRGAANMEIFSPMTRQPESPLGMACSLAAVAVFVGLGGHRLLLEALADSYIAMPATSLGLPASLGLTDAGLGLSLGLMGTLLRVALTMAAPVIVTLFLIDVSFGLLNRAAPSINVSQLSLGLRSLVGLGMLALSVTITFATPLRELGGLALGLLRGAGP